MLDGHDGQGFLKVSGQKKIRWSKASTRIVDNISICSALIEKFIRLLRYFRKKINLV